MSSAWPRSNSAAFQQSDMVTRTFWNNIHFFFLLHVKQCRQETSGADDEGLEAQAFLKFNKSEFLAMEMVAHC